MSWHNSRNNRSSPQHEKYTFERKVTKFIPPHANRGLGSDKDSDKDRNDELDGGVAPQAAQTYAGPPPATVVAELESLRRENENGKKLLSEAIRKLELAADIRQRFEDENRRLHAMGSEQSGDNRDAIRRLQDDNQRLVSENSRVNSDNSRLQSELHSRIRETEERYTREVDEIRAENSRLRDERERLRGEIGSVNTELSRNYEQLQSNYSTVREENDRLRMKVQHNDRLKDQSDHMEQQLEELRAALRAEQQRSGMLQDELDRVRADQHAAEVERQVTVEREGMRARADLLRKVYDNHKAVASALKTLRSVRTSDPFMKMKNSTRDLGPKELVLQIEQTAEALQRTVANSTHIIKTYFTTNEKLTCGMSAEWYKNDAGKPRALEEKVTTTTVITTRPVSPGAGVSPSYPSGSPTYARSASPTYNNGMSYHTNNNHTANGHTGHANGHHFAPHQRSSSPQQQQPISSQHTTTTITESHYSSVSPTAGGKY